MKAREMPYAEMMRWKNKVDDLKESGHFTKQEWCEIGRQLQSEHGLSERVAIRIMHGTFSEAIDVKEKKNRTAMVYEKKMLV